MKKIKWACPKCGTDASGRHGKGGAESCKDSNSNSSDCYGFICECDDDCSSPDHGETHDDQCHNANCYHCGWGGAFPEPLFDPKKLKGWAKQAYEAGWKPPAGWKP